MNDPQAAFGRRGPRPRLRRYHWAVLGGVVCGLVVFASAEAVSFHVTRSTETLAGVQTPAQFLSHWQLVGSSSGVTPRPVPPLVSANPAAPTRLPVGTMVYELNAGRTGDLALVWQFNETVGISPATEIELSFHIQYLAGTASSSAALTVYVETQPGAIGATVGFTVYWDSGSPRAVTFTNQLEVAQVCSAVGACP
jgi:hypothetical protein